MKKIVLILVLGLVFSLTACSGNISDGSGNKDSESESLAETLGENEARVVFANNVQNAVTQDAWGKIPAIYNTAGADEDILYAFSLDYVGGFDKLIGNDTDAIYEQISQVMKENGLMVVSDCSYYTHEAVKAGHILPDGCYANCVIVGTKSQILSVFTAEREYPDGDGPDMGPVGARYEFGNGVVRIAYAVRPDYLELAQKAGWNPATQSFSTWKAENGEKFNNELGVEETVSLVVEVQKPTNTK